MLFCFLLRDRKEVDPDVGGSREGLRVEGRGTVIRIYCVKKSVFNFKKCVNALERA